MVTSTDIRKQIGQLFLVGFDGLTVPASFKTAIQKFNLGGTIYFKRNVESPVQLATLTNELQLDCRLKDSPPLIISIDHEGGKVDRLSPPFTRFAGMDHVGEIGSPKLAFHFGLAIGKELEAFGVNIDFAPVVDVLTNPKNPIIAGRAFSSNPEVCAKMASGVCRGLQKSGVGAVAKHFPGHGDTNEDSHLTLPVVDKSLEDLEQIEFIPFRRMIRSRVEGIMTAHIINKSLDPDLPATLSPKIINDILRTQLRFQKIVFSDDLEMKAIADNYGAEEAAVMAIQAGCDILIYRGDPGFPEGPYEAIVKAVQDRKISKERIEVSAQRVINFKKAYASHVKPIEMAQLEKKIGLPEHRVLAEAIAKKELPQGWFEDSKE
ncbi:MAG: beta-N-acetylhexosaminidase [Proteobacteria bacterium]|nr:beta-N-acetylhexosaminidase [Pseudomonadota bacterium]